MTITKSRSVKETKIGKLFLHNDYLDTLGMDIEKDKVMIIEFAGGLMKIKVKQILDNGIVAEAIMN